MRHIHSALRPVLVSLAALVTPSTFWAQTVQASAYTQVRQRTDDPFYSKFPRVVDSACEAAAVGASGLQSAVVPACSIAPTADGNPLGTAIAYGAAIFDPAAGAIRSGAGIRLDDYTLSQFVGTFDPVTGDRIYTGVVRPDLLDVYSSVALSDRFSLTTLGVTPSTLSFALDWNGSFQTDIAPGSTPYDPDVSSYAVNALGFCIGAVGSCATGGDAFGGMYFASLSNGVEQFFGYSSAPTWAPSAAITFTGTHLPGSVSGTLKFTNLPVPRGVMDFYLSMQSEANFAHRSVALGFGSQDDACDPGLDPTCELVAPVDMTGDVFVDFTHSLVLRSYTVYDAAGNDITAQSQLTFASGLTPLSAPTTAAPEPGSFVLLATGLGALLAKARRVRKSARCQQHLAPFGTSRP